MLRRDYHETCRVDRFRSYALTFKVYRCRHVKVLPFCFGGLFGQRFLICVTYTVPWWRVSSNGKISVVARIPIQTGSCFLVFKRTFRGLLYVNEDCRRVNRHLCNDHYIRVKCRHVSKVLFSGLARFIYQAAIYRQATYHRVKRRCLLIKAGRLHHFSRRIGTTRRSGIHFHPNYPLYRDRAITRMVNCVLCFAFLMMVTRGSYILLLLRLLSDFCGVVRGCVFWFLFLLWGSFSDSSELLVI